MWTSTSSCSAVAWRRSPRSGSSNRADAYARYLITVRSEEPRRRVDVVPVVLWDPPADLLDADPAPGQSLWVAGSVQRRFWSGPEGRRSRLEVIADQVCLRSGDADGEPEASE